MSNKDWQVGPVLKDKLGSQGTLFRGGTKYSAPGRFPKGYTPERQKEIADAVVRPSTTVSFRTGTTHQFGTDSKEFKDRKIRGSGDMSTAPLYHESRQHVRSLVDNVARSTVPVQHLSGVQFRTGESTVPHLDRGKDPKDAATFVAGHYDRSGDALSRGAPVIRVRPGQEQSETPIHEIGHHVSHTEDPRRALYRSPEMQGREEGRADDYAHEHYRNPEGMARPDTFKKIYAGGIRSERRTNAFYNAYHGVRGTQDPMDRVRELQHQMSLRAQREEAENMAQGRLF